MECLFFCCYSIFWHLLLEGEGQGLKKIETQGALYVRNKMWDMYIITCIIVMAQNKSKKWYIA